MSRANTPAIQPNLPLARSADGAPWWRFPVVWMVVGGPLTVVVASFITLWLAMTHIDPVIAVPASPTAAGPEHLKSAHQPAMQARNHAATPVP
jgi:uncharacterized protein